MSEWVRHAWWVIGKVSSQVVLHVQPVIQHHSFIFLFEVRTWFEIYLPFLLSGRLSQTPLPPPVIPVNSGEKRHIYHQASSSPHTHSSPSPPHYFTGLPCFNMISVSQDLWNDSFPSLLLSKDRCSLPKQVWRTDWVSVSVPGIKRLDLPFSTN